MTERALFEYLLRLGDSPLILAQRLGEWVGKGPIVEEDMALANVGLDLLGQARLWLAYAGEVEARFRGTGRSEDQLAFLRDGGDFRNLLIVELPNGNYADTMARQFLFDAWHLLLLRALVRSGDPRIAEIAAKGAKEAAYHAERSADWIIRLGDGTDESHAKMQAAIDEVWMYGGEMFMSDATDAALVEAGIAADVRALEAPWRAQVDAVLAEATLSVPAAAWMQGGGGRGGRQGVHTEHLGHLLAEMQFLQRAYPGGAMVTAEQRAMMEAVAAAPALPRIPLGTIWQTLQNVPDPEVPVVSVIELGIVRAIEWDEADAGKLMVRVTPTYSGCPATELIMTSIRDALIELGVPRVEVRIELAPAWTTDWIVPAAREKLRAFGIAPPVRGEAGAARVDVIPLRRAATRVGCPRCGSSNTQLLSQFGSTACKAQYRCSDCLEPFDYFKPH